jgi:hypothetical protein
MVFRRNFEVCMFPLYICFLMHMRVPIVCIKLKMQQIEWHATDIISLWKWCPAPSTLVIKCHILFDSLIQNMEHLIQK